MLPRSRASQGCLKKPAHVQFVDRLAGQVLGDFSEARFTGGLMNVDEEGDRTPVNLQRSCRQTWRFPARRPRSQSANADRGLGRQIPLDEIGPPESLTQVVPESFA